MPRKNYSKTKIKAGPTKAQTSHKSKTTPQEHMLAEHGAKLEASRSTAISSHKKAAAQYGASQVARVTGLMTRSELERYNRGGRIGAGGMAASHGAGKSPWGKKNTPPSVLPAHKSYSTSSPASAHTSGSGSHQSPESPSSSTPKPKIDKKLGAKYAKVLSDAKTAVHGDKMSKDEIKKIRNARTKLKKMRKNLVKKGYGSLDKEHNKKGGHNAHGIYKALTGKSASTIKK